MLFDDINRLIIPFFSVSTRVVPLSLRRYHDNAERQMVLSDVSSTTRMLSDCEFIFTLFIVVFQVQQKSQEEKPLSGRG